MSLAVLVVVAAAVGVVAATGAVGAQDAGGNETTGNTSATNATDESFYSPSEEDPLNARFRDCCSHTVDSVDEGVLNLNIVYGMADGSYDVEITASGLSEGQIEDITFDSEGYDTNDLSRTDIVGMDFTGVPVGEYEFTVSVVGTDDSTTVPLEVTEGDAATESTANESAANETEMANATADNATVDNATADNATGMGNATITAMPSAANATANHTVSVTVGPEAAGNLTGVAINYTEGNVSTIGAALVSVNVTSQNGTTKTLYTGENVSAIGYGFSGEKVNISFGGTHVKPISAGDVVTIVYSGVKNAPQPGNYNVTVDINPAQEGGTSTAQLSVTKGGANATTTTTMATTTMATGTMMTTGTTGGGAVPQTVTAGGGAGTSGGTGAAGTGGGTSGGQQGTEAGGPGFGVVVAVVALLAAALLAVRRN